MSELRRLLEGAGQDRHAAIIAEHMARATTAELVAVLARPAPHLTAFVTGSLAGEVVGRGIEAVSELGRSLLAEPLTPGARRLAEILAEIHREQPTARDAVTAALTKAIYAAIDGGAGTWAVGELVSWLAECVAEAGAPEPTRALGRRLLALAASEPQPYSPLLVSARTLATGHADSAVHRRHPRADDVE